MKQTRSDKIKDFYFTISRVFDSPVEKVWDAWTSPEKLKAWFGPKGFEILENHLNLKVGGSYHYGLKTPEGKKFWGYWKFLDIEKSKHLMFLMSFADENAKVVKHPWNDNWPLYIHAEISFLDIKGKTKLTVTLKPYEASNNEYETFVQGADSMKQGWDGTLEQLENFLL